MLLASRKLHPNLKFTSNQLVGLTYLKIHVQLKNKEKSKSNYL